MQAPELEQWPTAPPSVVQVSVYGTISHESVLRLHALHGTLQLLAVHVACRGVHSS